MAPNFLPLPLAQPAVVQRYTIDYETVGRLQDPWPAVDELLSRVGDTRWSRARACWGCNNWETEDGLTNLPFRPGAGSSAVQSCSSCHYAKLDEVEIEPKMATATLDAMKAFREGWRAYLTPKKPKLKFTRTLVHQEGYVGKRSERPEDRPAFRGKPNDPNERIDCPWCKEKNGARVERYTRIKPKEDPVRFVSIACQVGTCGKRWQAPEATPAETWPTYKKGETPMAAPK